MTDRIMSDGEWRVGVTFNPGGNARVDEIKRLSAQLIDLVAEHGKDERCTVLAQDGFEAAAMWAVKSVTKRQK